MCYAASEVQFGIKLPKGISRACSFFLHFITPSPTTPTPTYSYALLSYRTWRLFFCCTDATPSCRIDKRIRFSLLFSLHWRDHSKSEETDFNPKHRPKIGMMSVLAQTHLPASSVPLLQHRYDVQCSVAASQPGHI